VNLTLEEMETALTMCADDRGTWQVFSDDPVMQRRLEAIGATLVRPANNGIGKFYTLRADQVLIRTGKRKMSEAQKAQLGDRLRAMRSTPSGT
jgi:thiazole synthase ThiGH ThiG subunit